MGTVYSFQCQTCGNAGRVFVGSTMASHKNRERFAPAICQDCKSLVEANVWGEPCCAKCKGPRVVLYGKDTQNPAEPLPAISGNITANSHRCPSCGTYGLRFIPSGILAD